MSAVKEIKERAPEIMTGSDAYYDYTNAYRERMLTDDQKDVLESFAFTCGHKLLPFDGNNSVISPLSIYYAFAMLTSGADTGKPKDELLDFLHMNDDLELQDLCRKTYEAIHFIGEAKKVECIEYAYNKTAEAHAIKWMNTSFRNSIWVSEKNKVSEEYIECLTQNYYASVGQVDFFDAQSGNEISDWVEKNTNGLIKPELLFDKETIITLINTLYYCGAWDDEFDPDETKPGKFYRSDGSETEAQFMKKLSLAYYSQLKNCKVVTLDLDDSCEMRFILPESTVRATEILDNSEQYLTAMTTECDRYAEINLMLPKFNFQRRTNLMEDAEKLSLQEILDNVTFGRISQDIPKVSSVIHDARIKIDEQGVEGAAMTVIGLIGAGIPMRPSEKINMIFDRPFLFGLYERKLGVWLFLGFCADPTEK